MSQDAGNAAPILSAGTDEAVAARPQFALGRGLSYRVLARHERARARYVAELAQSDQTAIVPAGGGFVGNLKVWENLVLPATYHGTPRLADLDARASELFALLGGAAGYGAQLCGELPDRLSLLDLRRAAFVRAMLIEPEMIVFDALFEGLAGDEIEAVRSFDRVFHRYFPFRTAVWVDRDVPGLPALAVAATFTLGD